MSQQRAKVVVVTDKNGLRGTIDTAALSSRRDDGQVLVHLDNGQQALVPVDELLLENDGSFMLPFSLSEFAGGDAARRDVGERVHGGGSEKVRQAGDRASDETVVVPVVAEQLSVEKRRVESGSVRIRKVVHEREEVVDEPLMREEVQVKRVPINRVVDAPIPVRHIGNTMIVSLLEEVLVVEKRLMLKEELHITKSETETFKPQRIMLRSEEATIERVDAPARHDEGGGGVVNESPRK